MTERFLADPNPDKINLGVVSDTALVFTFSVFEGIRAPGPGRGGNCMDNGSRLWSRVAGERSAASTRPSAKNCAVRRGHAATMTASPWCCVVQICFMCSALYRPQGAYRDDDGKPMVLRSVREAEKRVAGTHYMEYLPIGGKFVG